MNSRVAITRPILCATALLALSACGFFPKSQPLQEGQVNNTIGQEVPGANTTGSNAFPEAGLVFGKGTGGGGSSATGIQVNAFLWRGALNTLAFMPLVSADPFGGVIITDWYVPPGAPGERFKVNAYILSQQMTATAVKVSLFHQVLQGGQWVDSPTDPGAAGALEDRILAQAANLQAQAQNSKS